ncbi:MAG: hypothetical protein AAFX03_11825 [Pseudomonadota bacterium]
MSARLILLGAALVAGGALTGLATASRAAGAAGADGPMAWTDPEAPVDYSGSASRFLFDLAQSPLFAVPPERAAPQTEDAPDAEPETVQAGFPDIGAVALIEGRPTALLLLASGETLVARRGTELPGGWIVANITLKQITASRDGEDFEFDVFPKFFEDQQDG